MYKFEEGRDELGRFKKGRKSPRKGKSIPWAGHSKPHTEKSKEKMSENRKGKCKNEDNPNWKGDDVGMVALHSWVARRKGRPKKCEQCGLDDENRKYHWANISGEYRRDVDDFIRLCVPCHKKMDLERIANNSL